MRVTRIDEAPIVMSDENFTGRRLFASTEAVVVHMTVEPGRAVAPHAASMDMEFFVLEGRARISVGEEGVELGPGALVESPGGLLHGIENLGTGKLRLLVIKNRGA